MNGEHTATLLLAIAGVLLTGIGVSLAVLLGRNPRLHLLLIALCGIGVWVCFSRAIAIYREEDTDRGGGQPIANVPPRLDETQPRPTPTGEAGQDLPLSVPGEHWRRARGAEVARFDGDWCHPYGVTQLRFRAGQARYRFDAVNGGTWKPISVWRSGNRIRVETADHSVMFFMPGETPDYVRQVIRKENGLGQITVSGDFTLWSCGRCLLDDAGLLTWCKGDREYDLITAQRRAQGRSNLPPPIRIGPTDASVLLGRDTV